MEIWELAAREGIRDIVARYNANGDSGRFAQVLELFAPDAVMETSSGRRYAGHEEILTIFTGVKINPDLVSGPSSVRHFTASLQIDFENEHTAVGRCYYMVLTAIGLDHWGRYIDRYALVGEDWRFSHRRVTRDGSAPNSLFAQQP